MVHFEIYLYILNSFHTKELNVIFKRDYFISLNTAVIHTLSNTYTKYAFLGNF